jgi:hypothetical protein
MCNKDIKEAGKIDKEKKYRKRKQNKEEIKAVKNTEL